MATISELIRSEADGTISFGDYTLGAKAKLDNFEHQGDIYKGEDIFRDHQVGAQWHVRI